jgi:hypothetical protein
LRNDELPKYTYCNGPTEVGSGRMKTSMEYFVAEVEVGQEQLPIEQPKENE